MKKKRLIDPIDELVTPHNRIVLFRLLADEFKIDRKNSQWILDKFDIPYVTLTIKHKQAISKSYIHYRDYPKFDPRLHVITDLMKKEERSHGLTLSSLIRAYNLNYERILYNLEKELWKKI